MLLSSHRITAGRQVLHDDTSASVLNGDYEYAHDDNDGTVHLAFVAVVDSTQSLLASCVVLYCICVDDDGEEIKR